jgi:heterodisulfide reductase subunit A
MLCTCGGSLGAALDYNLLIEFLEAMGNEVCVEVTPFLCQPEGLRKLETCVAEKKPQGIVVAACSKRLLLPLMKESVKKCGFTTHQIEFVNLREHCAWVHRDDKEMATCKAKRMLRASIEKARFLQAVGEQEIKVTEKALVIGGGVAGIQAALDLAEQGFKVYLLDRSPTIGGHMALLVKTYPTDDCAICILGPKMADAGAHLNIELWTYCEVKKVEKFPSGFKVTVLKKPRYVDFRTCTGCGTCAEKCPIKVRNEWNGGLGFRKAIYIPFPQSLPRKYTVDPENCLFLTKGICKACEKVCPAKAVDFNQKPEEVTLEVGSIIVATGFEEFNPSSLSHLGFGTYPDVITQFQLARILDPSGPTEGKLKRLSDGCPPKRIVMIQCVGSRDPYINAYCSRYCCMAAMKNSILIKIEQDPEADITIIYKDVRAAGKGFEEYYVTAKERFGLKFVEGNVTLVTQDKKTGKLSIEYQLPNGNKRTIEADLVVLSCAMVPSKGIKELARILGLEVGPEGFFRELDRKVSSVETKVPGIFLCGCAEGPKDIPESVAQASAAAAKAAIAMSKFIKKPLNVPLINKDYCGKCEICLKVCPYHAISINPETNVIQVDVKVCQSCGLCETSCPNHAITMVNTSLDIIQRQITAVLSNDINGPKPLILVLACEECGYTVLDSLGHYRKQYSPSIIPVIIPCQSLLSISHVLHAFAQGADGVLILGCPKERCHFEKGIPTAQSRIDIVRKILEKAGFSPDRVQIMMLSGNMTQDFLTEASKLTSAWREIHGGK